MARLDEWAWFMAVLKKAISKNKGAFFLAKLCALAIFARSEIVCI